jgi:hypothetical protein
MASVNAIRYLYQHLSRFGAYAMGIQKMLKAYFLKETDAVLLEIIRQSCTSIPKPQLSSNKPKQGYT